MRPYFEELTDRLRVQETDAAAFPEHLHTQAELLYLFEGRAVMTVDGAAWRLEPGDLCVCFPGSVHGYLEPEGARALMLIFSPELCGDFAATLKRMRPERPLLRAEELAEDVGLCMEQLRRECALGGDERVMRGYIQVALARALSEMRLTGGREAVTDIAYRVIAYLSEHFAEPVTLEGLARELGVSRSHLSHLFSQRLGTNFRRYVNALRVDQACLMLRETEWSVTQIAYECGFDAQRTFNRAFGEQYGIAPREYRKRWRGKEGG